MSKRYPLLPPLSMHDAICDNCNGPLTDRHVAAQHLKGIVVITGQSEGRLSLQRGPTDFYSGNCCCSAVHEISFYI